MKITRVEPLLIDRYLLVRVHTDAGVTGIGEAGTWAYLDATARVMQLFGDYLVGQDPFRIEHHWQYLYRSSHFRGAVIMGALSAIDIALWDIMGKALGVPCYQLLGGKVRDRARVYFHVYGSTTEELVAGCVAARDRGFTAVGHLTTFIDDWSVSGLLGKGVGSQVAGHGHGHGDAKSLPFFKTHAAKIHDAIDSVRRYREAVGNDVDLCLEIHRRLTPAEAVVLAQGIAPYHPMFYEDPVLPDNLDEMAQVASQITIPIATGERLHTIWEFQMLLARGAVQYVRPDVCLAGGITGSKKIATLAEAHHVGVVPHNPLSPVSTAACLQLAASIPNFALQEYPRDEDKPPKSEMMVEPLRCEDGFLIVPDAPGIGVELREDAASRFPFRQRPIVTRLHRDGSVVDQ